jgi:NitT/TauT family transport system substrate-binding protein
MRLPAFRRRRLLAASVVGASSLAFPALRAQELKPELSRLNLAVSGKATFYDLPLTIAEQLGYFKAEGLDVAIEDHPDAGLAMQSVLTGAAQVGSGAFQQLVVLRSRSLAYQAFVLQGRAPQIAMGMSTRTTTAPQGVASLSGRRIGVSAAGSSTHLVAQLMLQRSGLNPQDARFIAVGSGAGALAALRSGQLDAMSNTEPVMTMLEQQGDVRIVADTRSLKGSQALFGGTMPAACLYAAQSFIADHPRTCQALTHAIVHALKWLQTAGPGDIVRTVPEDHLLGDRALYLASFQKVRETISPDGLMPADGGATALRAQAMFDSGIDRSRIDPDRLFTNVFARRSKERFKL